MTPHINTAAPPALNLNTPPASDDTKKLKWTVEFEVAEEWVADGFIMTSERALEMLANDLGHALGEELTAHVIAAPDAGTLARIQGYKSVKEFLTDSKLRVTNNGIVESKYDVKT